MYHPMKQIDVVLNIQIHRCVCLLAIMQIIFFNGCLTAILFNISRMDLQPQEAIIPINAENVWEMNEGDAENQELAGNETQLIQTVFDSNPGVKADVWKEFVSVGKGDDGRERGSCIHCNKTLVIERNNGTSALRRHVLSCLRKPKIKHCSNSIYLEGASVSKSSCDREGVSNILSKKRQHSSISEDKTRSAMLMGLDILDCPVCFEALTIPIFQCDNGHLACSSCCPKLSNKCPSCVSPIGHNRCRAMESVLESVFVPCRNFKLGCTEKFSYGKESTHEKECKFSLCSCPVQDCDYTGSYNQIYSHFVDEHRHKPKSMYFVCGGSVDVHMNIASDEILVLSEFQKKLLFAVQCFNEPHGVYMSVRCVAPSAPVVGKFAYRLSYSMDGHTLSYKSSDVRKVLEVSSQMPQDNFMFIPHCLLRGEEIKVCIGIKVQSGS